MLRREDGIPLDRAALAVRIVAAVDAVVGPPAGAGLTHQRRRDVQAELRDYGQRTGLNGFGSTAKLPVRRLEATRTHKRACSPIPAASTEGPPAVSQRRPGQHARTSMRRAAMTAPAAGAARKQPDGAVPELGVPGVVTSFLSATTTTRATRTTCSRIAEALPAPSTSDLVSAGGGRCRFDCQDLARAGTPSSPAEVKASGEDGSSNRGAQPGARQIPCRPGPDLHCGWATTPARITATVPLAAFSDIVWKAKPRDLLFEAPIPRTPTDGQGSSTSRGGRQADESPRDRHRVQIELHRAPRGWWRRRIQAATPNRVGRRPNHPHTHTPQYPPT